MAPVSRQAVTHIGRYKVLGRIASGGMGTVHLARQLGDAGFARLVAIKFLHAHLATVPEFVSRFLDEARLAARIRHPNVVTTIDVVQQDDTLCLVMEYVRGDSAAALLAYAAKLNERIPQGVAIRIVVDTLRGLHAAHTATDDDGAPLSIVHRDVSPQNVLVGLDGAAHLLDFGIAKAANSLHTTAEGQLKGKLRYMAPEQIVDQDATLRSDIYAASVVLWELLTGRRLFEAANDGALLAKVLEGAVLPPSHFAKCSSALDDIVLRGLARDPGRRAASAEEMARELEKCGEIASPSDVAAWVEHLAGAKLREREAMLTADGEPERSDVHVPTVTPSNVPDVVTVTAPRADAPERTERMHDGLPAHAEAASAEPSPNRKRRRPLFLSAAWVALTALVAMAAFAASRQLHGDERAADRAPAPSTPAPSTAASSSALSPASSEVAAVPSNTASAGAPSASSTSTGPTRLATSATSASPAPRRQPNKSKAGHAPDCSTPYYRDESGIRRVRRECL